MILSFKRTIIYFWAIPPFISVTNYAKNACMTAISTWSFFFIKDMALPLGKGSDPWQYHPMSGVRLLMFKIFDIWMVGQTWHFQHIWLKYLRKLFGLDSHFTEACSLDSIHKVNISQDNDCLHDRLVSHPVITRFIHIHIRHQASVCWYIEKGSERQKERFVADILINAPVFVGEVICIVFLTRSGTYFHATCSLKWRYHICLMFKKT